MPKPADFTNKPTPNARRAATKQGDVEPASPHFNRYLSPAHLLTLQSTIGNRAVQRLLRDKMSIKQTQASALQLMRGKMSKRLIKKDDKWVTAWAVEHDDGHAALEYPPSVTEFQMVSKTGEEVEYDVVDGKYVLNVEKTFGQPPAPTLSNVSPSPSSPALNQPQTPEDDDRELPPTQFGKGEIKEYAKHYRQTRLFHGTESHNINKIDEEGLKTSLAGTGKDTEKDDRRGKVYLGRDYITSEAYASNDPKNMARVMLPPNRTVWNNDPETAKTFDTFSKVQRPEQLWTDPRMGPAAFVTGQDVPAEQVYFGKNSELLNSPKADGILKVVQQHYDQNGEVPSIETLRHLHKAAVDEKEISDDPGDEHTSSHLPQKST